MSYLELSIGMCIGEFEFAPLVLLVEFSSMVIDRAAFLREVSC